MSFLSKVTARYVVLGFTAKVNDIGDFVATVTTVAKNAKFENPENAYWMCGEFSNSVAKIGRDFGVPIELWAGDLLYKQSIKAINKGTVVPDHMYLKIGDAFYDFTARQADPKSTFPKVGNKPLYPNSHKINRDPELRDDFWYEKLWKALDREK